MASIKAKQREAAIRHGNNVIIDNVETRQRVIRENLHAKEFIFIVSVPYSKECRILRIPKERLLEMTDLLVPGYYVGTSYKQNMTGKPVYRFDKVALRKLAEKMKGGHYCETLKLKTTWTNVVKQWRTESLRGNAGTTAEALIADLKGFTDIGELDKKGHFFHADLKDDNGDQYEVKLETGFLGISFSWAGQKWGNA